MEAKILEDGKVEVTSTKTEVQVIDGEVLLKKLEMDIKSWTEAIEQISAELSKAQALYDSIKDDPRLKPVKE